MSSWAAVVDSRATSGPLKVRDSLEIEIDSKCRSRSETSVEETERGSDVGRPRDSTKKTGDHGRGVRRSGNARRSHLKGRSAPHCKTNQDGVGPNIQAHGSMNPERGEGKLGKGKTCFPAPPKNAWHVPAETKQRLCSNITTEVHNRSDTSNDHTNDTRRSGNLSDNLKEILSLTDKSDDEETEGTEVPSGESSRASLSLLSQNDYNVFVSHDTYGVSSYPKGIENPGNVCFANSVLQALLGARPFCQIMYHLGKINEIIDLETCPVLVALSNIAKELQFYHSNFKGERMEMLSSTKFHKQLPSTVSVRLIVRLIHESFGIRYKGEQKTRQIEQEDAHEFLHCLLDALHQEFLWLQSQKGSLQEHGVQLHTDTDKHRNEDDGDEWLTQTGKRAVKQKVVTTDTDVKRASIITELFEGMQSTSISSRGNPPSITMHPFLVIEVPLYDPSITTLEDAIDALTATETISGYRPRGQDQQPCDATKAEKFNVLPNILAFHLMRFQFTGSTEKLRKHMRYNDRVRVKPSWLMPSSKDRHAEYELVSTISHHGESITRGHFTANVKHDGKWIHFDDETIYGLKTERVFHDEPYMLVYVKKNE